MWKTRTRSPQRNNTQKCKKLVVAQIAHERDDKPMCRKSVARKMFTTKKSKWEKKPWIRLLNSDFVIFYTKFIRIIYEFKMNLFEWVFHRYLSSCLWNKIIFKSTRKNNKQLIISQKNVVNCNGSKNQNVPFCSWCKADKGLNIQMLTWTNLQ